MSEVPVYLPSARRPHPGRPRKAECGHVSGTSGLQVLETTGANGRPLALEAIAPGDRPRWSEIALAAIAPRVLSLEQSALYLGVSPWTVRDLLDAGILRRVRVPLANGGELRKVLFDRADLDRLIEAWKDRA